MHRSVVMMFVLGGVLLFSSASFSLAANPIGSILIGREQIYSYNRGECVEFARRVSTAISPRCTLPSLGSNGGASDFWRLVQGDPMSSVWLARPNGGYDPPGPWDFILWGKPNLPGHIAVVKSVTSRQNRRSVRVCEQNWSRTTSDAVLVCTYNSRTQTWTLPKRNGYTCLGWMRPLYGLRPARPTTSQIIWQVDYVIKPPPRYASGRDFYCDPGGGNTITLTFSPGQAVHHRIWDSQGRVLFERRGNASYLMPPLPDGHFWIELLGEERGPIIQGRLIVTDSRPSTVEFVRWSRLSDRWEIVTEFPDTNITSDLFSGYGHSQGRAPASPEDDVGPNAVVWHFPTTGPLPRSVYLGFGWMRKGDRRVEYGLETLP